MERLESGSGTTGIVIGVPGICPPVHAVRRSHVFVFQGTIMPGHNIGNTGNDRGAAERARPAEAAASGRSGSLKVGADHFALVPTVSVLWGVPFSTRPPYSMGTGRRRASMTSTFPRSGVSFVYEGCRSPW